jgi:hypothetical protein
MKKYGIYHIFCDNDWRVIFDDQINSLINNNILNNIEKLYLTIIYKNQEDLDYISGKIQGLNIEISYKTNKSDEYEFPALNFIKELSEKNDCYLFYIHTKGVSINEKNMSWYHGSKDIKHLKECVNDWRKFMEYYIIENSKLCLNVLEDFDACGVNLIESPYKHFSGNFWWSKSDYIKKLPKLNTINNKHRWNAEFWVGLGGGNFFNFDTKNAGYTTTLKRDDYILEKNYDNIYNTINK